RCRAAAEDARALPCHRNACRSAAIHRHPRALLAAAALRAKATSFTRRNDSAAPAGRVRAAFQSVFAAANARIPSRMQRMSTPDAEPGGASVVVDALRRMGLLHGSGRAHCEPLSGGVSSDIWRVDLPGRSVCVKRALHRLRVAAEWEAPVERSLHEW